MCTLAFWPANDQGRFFLLMNRDEAVARAPATEVATFDASGMRGAYPLDPEGGGTWIGVNARGLALALLNENPEGWVEPVGRVFTTRGAFIPELLRDPAMTGIFEIERQLGMKSLEDFRPFRLVAVDTVASSVKELVWDGVKFESQTRRRDPFLLSSSPFNGLGAGEWRETELTRFTAALEGRVPTPADLFRLSALTARADLPPAFGLSFDEKDYATVSTTVVEVPVSLTGITLRYRLGRPHLSADGAIQEIAV